MTEFTSMTSESLALAPGGSEAEAVARAAARPASLAISGDSSNAIVIASPDGWSLETVEPNDDPVRPKFTRTVLTAAGFRYELDRLRGDRLPLLIRQSEQLIGHPEPTSIDTPTHDAVTVVLAPKMSDELKAWTAATNLTLDQWERHIEDCAPDIDAGSGPSSLDVLADARTWHVEVRRTVKRIKDANSDEEGAAEIKARSVGKVLASFEILVPVLRCGEPRPLTVRIDRDIDNSRISARIPGVARVLRDAGEAEFAAASDGWTVVV